jgi:hypothetical protein
LSLRSPDSLAHAIVRGDDFDGAELRGQHLGYVHSLVQQAKIYLHFPASQRQTHKTLRLDHYNTRIALRTSAFRAASTSSSGDAATCATAPHSLACALRSSSTVGGGACPLLGHALLDGPRLALTRPASDMLAQASAIGTLAGTLRSTGGGTTPLLIKLKITPP